MNREIKFRAWDKVNKEFIDGDFVEILGNGLARIYNEKAGAWYPHNGYVDSCNNEYFGIMQHTGLKANGVEIYEGDIVVFTDKGDYDCEWKGFVSFSDASFIIDSGKIQHYRWMDYDIKIIGNIYENSELLK